MRGLKEFFCKIVAAVICFGMKVFSGNKFVSVLKEKSASFYPEMKKGRIIYESCKEQGGDRCIEMSGYAADKMSHIRNNICKNRYHLFFRKIFYWLQGPGDRLQDSRRSGENKELELKKEELFYLVPE